MATSLNTINVDGVTYDSKAYAESKKAEAKSTNNDLDKNAFLKLLVTQLENQDPLDPQDNSEFVAEMAQFSSLEQMTNMSESLTNINKLVGNMDTSLLVGQLSGMIGKGSRHNFRKSQRRNYRRYGCGRNYKSYGCGGRRQ